MIASLLLHSNEIFEERADWPPLSRHETRKSYIRLAPVNASRKTDLLSLPVQEVSAAYTEAWNNGSSSAVAECFAPTGQLMVNGGRPRQGRHQITNLAETFLGTVPNLTLTCDGANEIEGQICYLWTVTGHDADTGKAVRISGWDTWGLTPDLKIDDARMCFNTDEFRRQAGR